MKITRYNMWSIEIKEVFVMNVQIVYWSGSGNTKQMADAVAEGVKGAGAEASVVEVGDANAADLANEKVFALGCPSMGCEQLEESEMEPFVDELESLVSGKNILLFGSYGWGDGEWMRNWAERMVAAGAVMVEDEGIICNDAPDDDTIAALKAAGAKLVTLA